MNKMFIGLGAAAIMAAMMAGYWFAIDAGGEAVTEEARGHLENAVRQAAISCYAVEGRYPASIDALVENYGLSFDSESYIVRYDCFADNVMPDIEVYLR